MGGKCVECGFDDDRALEFDHIVPMRVVHLASAGGHDCGEPLYRRIGGERDGLQLLCANCHAIKMREQDNYDGRLHLNISAKAA